MTPLKGVQWRHAFLSGDSAWSVGPDGTPAPGGGPNSGAILAIPAAEERQIELAITPAGWVKAAMTANPTMETKTVNGKKMTVVSFTWKGKYKVNGYVDNQNVLEKVETWLPHAILGDMLVEASYSDYRDFSGVKFPMKIVQKEGGFPVLDLTVKEVHPNAPVNIRVPAAAQIAAAPLRLVSQQLADGVWLITAGVQSLAVEFKDYTAVVEGATDEVRSIAVIGEVKRLVPNKPIRYVINSHHHLDHAGGLRTFVAEGATIITADVNKPFYEKIFKLPRTLVPDKLWQNPKPATFVAVKDKYVLTDGTQSMEVHTLPDSTHASDMLIAYVPKAKLLYTADMCNPPDFIPLPPDGPAPLLIGLIGSKQYLLDKAKLLNLDVQQFVPAHDTRAIPLAEFQKSVEIEHEKLQRFDKANNSSSARY